MSTNYKNLTASGLVKSGPGLLSVATLTAGADAATLTLYDNDAGSGPIIDKLAAVANTTATLTLPSEAAFSSLYGELTGTGPSASFYYL